MELIVKIGADQQQLQQTVNRMQTQFKNMNVSMPTGWAGTGQNAASWNAAIARQSDSPLDSLLNKGAAKRLLGLSLKGGIAATVIYGLKELVDFSTKNLSQNFWERTYGISDEIVRRAQKTYSDLRKSVKTLLTAREKEVVAQEKDILASGTPEGRSVRLGKQVKEAEGALDRAQKDLQYAKANRKEATGVFGQPLTDEQRARLSTEQSNAEKRVIDAQAKLRELESQYKAALAEVTTAAVEREREQTKQKAERQKQTDKRSTFEADALAKVGLFSGSSLLMNPDFSVQREQLAVLNKIEANQRHNTSDFV